MDNKKQITSEERARRAASIASARGSLRLEGFILPPEAESINQRYINGEIDIQEHIEAIKAICKED